MGFPVPLLFARRSPISPFPRFSSKAVRNVMSSTGILLALALSLLGLACKGSPPPAPASNAAPQTVIPEAVFPDGWSVKLSLAVTPEEQERGLMFVEDLPDNRGMIFLYETDDIRPFWMKNCKISMDFIWMSADGTVVDITRDVQPCPADPCPTYQAKAPSRFNLEVRGGLCAAHGLKPGDKVRLQNLPQR